MITSLIVETYKSTGKLNVSEEFKNVKIPVYDTQDIIEYIQSRMMLSSDDVYVFKAFDAVTQSLNQRVVTKDTFKY